jgi:hypothetical protein
MPITYFESDSQDDAEPRRKFAENTAIMVTASHAGHGMIAKLLLQNLIWIVAMGAPLFAVAGTLHWPAAWIFLGTMAILGISAGLWLTPVIKLQTERGHRSREILRDPAPCSSEKCRPR